MDIFLLARCRFIFGSDSGPPAVAFVFGTPVVHINVVPNVNGASRRDLLIQKQVRLIAEDRLLGAAETSRPPYLGWWSPQMCRRLGLEIIDNTADEISEVVVEMMDRLDGTIRYSEDDERLQERFHALADFAGVGTIGPRLGRAFLRRHEYLTGAEGTAP